MFEDILPPPAGIALFSAGDYGEINQLADLLFNDAEQAIQLHSEHEIVTRAWILSALEKSDLAKKSSTRPEIYWIPSESEKTNLPQNAWVYLGNGNLMRAGLSHGKTTILYFPTLSAEKRAIILDHICMDTLQTHVLSIPLSTIKKSLAWQSHYCADQQVLAETIVLLQRAVNRFLLTHTNSQQANLLEPQHVAEVLVDWQNVTLTDLLRETEDDTELKVFLTENIIGQSLAIEQFTQAKEHKKLFILAGAKYSGKKTFIEHYAQFTHGAKHFCIPFDVSFFSKDAAWSSILLPIPHYNNNNSRLSLLEIVKTYPHAIIMLTHVEENPVLLQRLQHDIKRSFFQIDNQCISIAHVTWMLLIDIEISEETPIVIQESIFMNDAASELSDILYQPTIKISSNDSETYEIDGHYTTEAIKACLPETVIETACILPFSPLTEKDKKHIINKEIKRIIHCLRATYDVSIYYQEEVIQFLLNQVNQAKQGLEALHKNLYQQIEHVLLKSLEKGAIADNQVLMLQLNDTGRVLQIIRTASRQSFSPAKLKL